MLIATSLILPGQAQTGGCSYAHSVQEYIGELINPLQYAVSDYSALLATSQHGLPLVHQACVHNIASHFTLKACFKVVMQPKILHQH